MKLSQFRVQNYRNILDSGSIRVGSVTAFVGQNESGKSNLFEALYCLNPIIPEAYKPDEDWPVDQWGNRLSANGKEVCVAEFILDENEIREVYAYAAPPTFVQNQEDSLQATTLPPLYLPKEAKIVVSRRYGTETKRDLEAANADKLDKAKLTQWMAEKLPKFVLIREYEMSGEQVELDQLKQRWDSVGKANRQALSNDDQTILIILDLAAIDLDEFLAKGQTADGRTVRSFDKRSASVYLTKQFQDLWTQKPVNFDIEIDGTTLNIFARDNALGMPVRLKRRSTGFRWYVSVNRQSF
jgi:hypothetical protein